LLGSWVSSEFVADGSIISLMKELGEETGDTIVLAMQNGLYVQYIHVVQATSAARLHVTLGTTRPLAGSGTGYAMLSTMSDHDVRRFVMRINAESKDDTPPIKLADVMEQVNSVRERGYSFTRDIVTRGGGMIAAPLPDSLSGPPLVIGIGGISEVMISRQEELAGVLTEKIAARFGRRSQQKYSAEEIEDPMVRAILRARRISADAAAASR
jgi:DNA-binding IclR family transcriptional regulator